MKMAEYLDGICVGGIIDLVTASGQTYAQLFLEEDKTIMCSENPPGKTEISVIKYAFSRNGIITFYDQKDKIVLTWNGHILVKNK